MASHYNELEEEIKRNEAELKHLEEELKGLQSVEKDTPRQSYQRQYDQIQYHMEQERTRLARNRALLTNFNRAANGIRRIRTERELLESEQDPELRASRERLIEVYERQITDAMSGLSDELAAEVRETILTEVRQNAPAEERKRLLKTIEEARTAIKRVREERDIQDEDAAVHEARERIIGIYETQIRDAMSQLPADVAEELRQSILNENRQQETAAEEKDAKVTDTATTHTQTVTSSFSEDVKDPADAHTDVKLQSTPPEEQANTTLISTETTDTSTNELEAKDPRNVALQESWQQANQEYETALEKEKAAIQRMMDIFAEERRIREEEGPFTTEAELDAFTAEYMRRKIEADETLTNARTELRLAERKMHAIEENMQDYAAAVAEAAKLNITVEDYEKLRKAAGKKNILQAVYDKEGLGQVDRRSKEGKEKAATKTDEIVAQVVEALREKGIVIDQNGATISQNGYINQNGGINIVVIDTVNINYGTNIPVEREGARTTQISEDQKNKISVKTKKRERIIPRTNPTNDGKEPLPGPSDMTGPANASETEETKEKTAAQISSYMDRTAGRIYQKSREQLARRAAIRESLLAGKGGDAARTLQENLDSAVKELETAVARGEPLTERQRATYVPISTCQEKVNQAQAELDTALRTGAAGAELQRSQREIDSEAKKIDRLNARLKDWQELYREVTVDGKYDAVGTEKRMKLIIGDYVPNPKGTPGDVTTNQYVDEETGELRPAWTDGSARKEGQIDPREFARLLDQEYGPVEPTNPNPTEPQPTEPTPTDPTPTDPTPTDPTPTDPTPTDPIHTDPTPTELTPTEPTPTEPQPTEPTPTEPQPTNPQPTEPQKPKRGLLTIMDELTQGLELGRKDGKRYQASNIRVAEQFKQELSQGNYLYNIVSIVPAIIKLPFNLLRKVSGKIMLGKKAKENIQELRERIAKLSEEDLMTIYTEYRGSRVLQERFPTILNTLLDERIQQFALSKVTAINTELEHRYQRAFSAIKQLSAIDGMLANTTDPAARKSLEDQRKALLADQAANIRAIRQGYIEANGWMSGGAHGFSQDMKAAASKLSCVGKRFAKDHDLDGELLHKQAQLEQLEMQALANGDNERALRTFVESERLLSENTEISTSIFGRRSSGKKYYSPLVEKLDYSDDPFIRNLFTTVAVTTAAVSAVRAYQQQLDNADLLRQQEAAIKQNEQIIARVNQMGKDISGKRGDMMAGMEAQNYQDTLNISNEIERGTLDTTNWGLGTRAYRAADDAGHTFYSDFYDSTQGAVDAITSQYAAGAITQAEAMELLAELSANTQATLGTVTQSCLDILRPYAASHPQFDLHGVEAAMNYMVQHPDAIVRMNQAMVDVTAMGDTLSAIQLQHVATLQTLPSNVQSYLLTFATTAGLAANVASSMNGNVRKPVYGNSVTEMVDEYATEQREAANQNGNSK